MVMVILWGIIYTFIMTFLCTPVKQQWSLERIGKCMNQIEVLMSLIMTNIVTDIFIFVLPIHSVWKLQMRKTEKMAVISCFALGAAYVPSSFAHYPLTPTNKQPQLRRDRHRPLLGDVRHRPPRQPHRNIPHDLLALQHRNNAGRPLHQHPHAPPLLPSLEDQAKALRSQRIEP